MTVTITCDGCGSRAALARGETETTLIKPVVITMSAPPPWGSKTLERELCQDCCRRVTEAADPRQWVRYEEAKGP